MLEALWSVEFNSSLGGHGNGIAVFETGRVFGGDSSMIYVGSYRVEHGVVHAEVKVDKYADFPGMTSVTGLNSFTLILTGTPDANAMTLTGHVAGAPDRKMTLKAVRRAELP